MKGEVLVISFAELCASLRSAVFSVVALATGVLNLNGTKASDEVSTTTDDAAIIDGLQAFLKRFVYLADESLYLLVSLWTLGTHLHQQFDFFGYLFIHSPEPQSGKSRLLELLHEISLNATQIQVAPSAAFLSRTAADKTHLLDEVDGWTNKEELRNVLNAGFQKGRSYSRLRESHGGKYVPDEFPVYAPRALAGIGTEILDRVTRDRTFMIRMVRQKHTERREPFRPARIKQELDTLRKSIAQWVKENREAVSDCYNNGHFPYLERFQDRTIDVSQSLAAILETVYSDQNKARAARETLARAIGITRGEQQATEDGHEILKGLASLATPDNPLIGNATELAERLHAVLDAELSQEAVFRVLRRYDFETKSTRLPGEQQPRYRYRLEHETLKDLVDRYIGEVSPGENANPNQ